MNLTEQLARENREQGPALGLKYRSAVRTHALSRYNTFESVDGAWQRLLDLPISELGAVIGSAPDVGSAIRLANDWVACHAGEAA